MDQQQKQFLCELFPHSPEEQVVEVFTDIFGPPIGDEPNLSMREQELSELKKALGEIAGLGERVHVSAIHAFCDRLPTSVKKHLELDKASITVEEAVNQIEEYISLVEVWNRNFPRHGGRDNHANNLVESIAYVFGELGEPVTFGTYPGQQFPSTKFGKVVESAFHHHGLTIKWKSPAKRVASAWKSGWRP